MRIYWTKQFKKDYKLLTKRGLDVEELDFIIKMIVSRNSLPKRNKDHELYGVWIGHRECHIRSDWLLIYRIYDDTLELVRTGTHSDLFV